MESNDLWTARYALRRRLSQSDDGLSSGRSNHSERETDDRQEFPLRPPKLVFQSTMWHPSVYDDGERKGELCISILHEPGIDPMNEYEDAGERWMPVHTVESILVVRNSSQLIV